jgi:hypothetical protein
LLPQTSKFAHVSEGYQDVNVYDVLQHALPSVIPENKYFPLAQVLVQLAHDIDVELLFRYCSNCAVLSLT